MDKSIIKLKPFDIGKVTRQDLIEAILKELGCSISSMPDIKESKSYTSDWEYFDPDKVVGPDELPDYWRMVYDAHNKPDMRDCRELHYKYVHTLEKILPRYPRVPVRGIFCLATNTEKKPDEIRAEDLIWIGNEF